MSNAAEVRKLEAGELVYQYLREQILSLAAPPGDMLSENSLSAQLKVSRPFVREALARLAEERCVVVYPQKGTAVSAIDPEGVRQAVHAHIVLEQALIGELCKKGLSEEDEVRLERALAAQETEAEDVMGFIMAQQRFHYCLAEACGKGYIWRLFRTLDCDVFRVNWLNYSTFNYRMDMASLTGREYAKLEDKLLLDNLKKGDEAAAGLICANHFNSVLLNMNFLQGIYPQYFQ